MSHSISLRHPRTSQFSRECEGHDLYTGCRGSIVAAMIEVYGVNCVIDIVLKLSDDQVLEAIEKTFESMGLWSN